MKDIPFKVDLEDSLPANAFNSISSELMNAVEAAGLGLDETAETTQDPDPTNIARAMTLAALSANFYTDSSASPNVVLLTPPSGWVQPNVYRDGAAYRFKCATSNTGPTTVSIAGIGVKALKNADGTDISNGSLTAGEYYTIQYVTAPSDFFILLAGSFTAGLNSRGLVASLRPVARYNIGGTTVNLPTSTSFATVPFNAVVFDSHSSVVTGAAWGFAVTKSGYYRISTQITLTGTPGFNGTTEAFAIQALVVGSTSGERLTRITYPAATQPQPSLSLDGVVFAAAGSTIRVTAFQNSGSVTALQAGAESNVCIELVEFSV